MIPYELDPSLHTAEPEPVRLDDGFSPPQNLPQAQEEKLDEAQSAAIDPALWAKSPF